MTKEESTGNRLPAVQNISAAAGFAYGVIGADIHVFGDGTPLYLLENWRPGPELDPEWLRELPSRMLNARFAVVEFTGRRDDLTEMCLWRDQGPRLAVRWLHGPGGQGKTRLAAELAAVSAAAGWKVVAATHGRGTVLPTPGSQDLRLDGAAGVLMVVDYADRWPLSDLTWLMSNALLHQVGIPARVLMLARTQDGWPAVRATLANHQAGTSSQYLRRLSEGSAERADMFNAARDSFAAHYSISDARSLDPPGSLDDPEMGLTLAVHMAALVAVDAHSTGRRAPQDMAGLTIYLLDREHLHWERLYTDSPNGRRPEGRNYLTPPGVMNHVVFSAALTGPVPHPTATAVLESIDVRLDTNGVITDHATCYPPADPGRVTVLEPLYPDRLAEDFLALTVDGHPADYPAQPWALSTAEALVTRRSDGKAPAPWLPRAVTFLAAATSRWPHLGTRCLYPLLREDPQIAIEAGSAALALLADLDDADMAILEAIETRLPEDRHVDLDAGAAALTTRLARHQLSIAKNPAVRGYIYHRLGIRLSRAGLQRDALAATEEAVKIRRILSEVAQPQSAEQHRDILQADLAVSLLSLGAELADLGRSHDALAPTQEAVEIERRLATPYPAAHEPILAGAVNNLANMLSGTGQYHRALGLTQEAVDIRRRLAQADPGAHQPGLAQSLTSLATSHAELGEFAEAVRAQQEAMPIWRLLANDNPSVYEPNLALALSNFGTWLGELGQYRQALAMAEESVIIRRRLAETIPAAFSADLAESLNNLGMRLWRMERRADALIATREAIGIRRRLAKTNPAANESALAISLANMAMRLRDMAQYNEALVPGQEAVAIQRHLASINPGAHETGLARSLSILAGILLKMARYRDAVEAEEEAVRVHRKYAASNPGRVEYDLAASLHNLSYHLSALGRHPEAIASAQEAAGIFRRLAKTNPANPAMFCSTLARTLSNLATQQDIAGNHSGALGAHEEEIEVWRQLTQADPGPFTPRLAIALSSLASRHVKNKHRDKAIATQQEAVDLLRRLANASPMEYGPELVTCLRNFAAILLWAGQLRKAKDTKRDAKIVEQRLRIGQTISAE